MDVKLPSAEEILSITKYSRFTSNPLRIGEKGLWGGHLERVAKGGRENLSLNIQRLAITVDDVDHLASTLSLVAHQLPDVSEYAKKLIGRQIVMLLCHIKEIAEDLAKTDKQTPPAVYTEFMDELDRLLREHGFCSIRDQLTAHMDALRFKTYVGMNKRITIAAIEEVIQVVKIYVQAILLPYRTERHMYFKIRNLPSKGATDDYYAGYIPFDEHDVLQQEWIPFNDFLRDPDPNPMCRYGVSLWVNGKEIRVRLYEGYVERMRPDYPEVGMWTVILFIYGGARGSTLVESLKQISRAGECFSLTGEDLELPDSCQIMGIKEYPDEGGYHVVIQWMPPSRALAP